MYILFEKFNNIDTYLMSRLMVFAVKGQWVHCEIVFNEANNIRASAWDKHGMEFCEWATLKNPDYFELYPLPSENWQAAFQYCKYHEGREYDRAGVLGMMYGLDIFNSAKKFCSELCYEVVKDFTGISVPEIQPSLVSPLSLRRMLINQEIQPVPISTLNQYLK